MAHNSYEPSDRIVANADRQKETGGNGNDNNGPKRKRKRSLMHILRVAAHTLRPKSGKSKSAAHVDAASRWKNIMCSVRPLHARTDRTPPRITEAKPVKVSAPKSEIILPSPMRLESSEVYTAPVSPAHLSVVSSSPSPSTSQYASALNLQELDDCYGSDDDEKDSYYDDKYGDEMIDVKAEQFIARFYEQMRLQQSTHSNSLRKRS